MNWIHILPIDDLSPHKEEGFDCDCKPQIDWGDNLIIHNSFDGREAVEWANKILGEKWEHKNEQ